MLLQICAYIKKRRGVVVSRTDGSNVRTKAPRDGFDIVGRARLLPHAFCWGDRYHGLNGDGDWDDNHWDDDRDIHAEPPGPWQQTSMSQSLPDLA